MKTETLRPDESTLSKLCKTTSDRVIAKRYGVSPATILNWRRRFGIAKCDPTIARVNNKRFAYDRNFFDTIDSPEKAYVLGFIVSDGHIRARGTEVCISISASDSDVLYAIRDAISGTQEIVEHTYTTNFATQTLATLRICSKHVVSRLNDLGLHHDKSHTALYPTIPVEFDRHFVRGMWDGDGCIRPETFSLYGVQRMILAVSDRMYAHTGCRLRHFPDGETHGSIGGTRRDRDAIAWMYQDATIKMQRKYDSYLRYWIPCA